MIDAELDHHWRYLLAAWEEAQGAPASLRRTLVVAALVDGFVDRLFAAQDSEQDRLAYRARFGETTPALAMLAELCAFNEHGPRLEHRAVTVPIEDYDRLSVEDFMVSLYNGHSVQRVAVVWPDGRHEDARALLQEAIAALATERREV